MSVSTGRHSLTTHEEVEMSATAATDSEVIELSELESNDMFDRISQFNMGISGSEFLRRWDEGEFDGVSWDAVPGLAEVAIAISFVR